MSEDAHSEATGYGDYDEHDLLDEAGRSERRLHVVSLLVGFAVLAAVGAGLWYWLSRPVHSLRSEVSYRLDEGKIGVDVLVSTDRPAQLRLVGQGQAGAPEPQSVPAGEGRRVAFLVPLEALQLGENHWNIELIEPGQPEPLERRPLLLYRDLTLTTDLSTIAPPDYPVTFRFQLAPGWTVKAQGQRLTAPSAVLPLSLRELFTRLDDQKSAEYTLTLPLVIVRPDGHELAHDPRIVVPLPTTRLEISEPTAPLTIAGAASVRVRGTTEPGAVVSVGGASAPVDAAGRFEVSVELGGQSSGFDLQAGTTAEQARALAARLVKSQGVEVEVLADAPNKVSQARYFDFLRVSPESAQRYLQLAR